MIMIGIFVSCNYWHGQTAT